MACRKRRPTFAILVQNLPMHVNKKDVSNTFTSFGEIQSIFVMDDAKNNTKEAIIRFLCEPDAAQAVFKYNGHIWDKNVIKARRYNERDSLPHRKFVDKCSMNRHARGPQFQPNSFYAVPKFTPNIFGSMIRNLPSRGAILSVGDTCHQLLGTNMGVMSHNFNLKPLSVPEERYILCTYVENAVTFYGQYTAKSGLLDKITSLLQQCCAVLPRLKKTPDYGKVYAAVYSGDGLWYRCKVKNNKCPGKSFVQYVDYGNSEEVDYNNMCELPDPLKRHPCLAPKCVLMNLSPQKEDSVSLDAICYLQETILGQHVVVTTCSPEDSSVYEVSKCMFNNKDIAAMLVGQKYAVCRPPPSLRKASHSKPVQQMESCGPYASSHEQQELLDTVASINDEIDSDEVTNGAIPEMPNVSSPKKKDTTVLRASNVLEEKLTGLEVTELKSVENSSKKENETPGAKRELESLAEHLQLVNSIRCNSCVDDTVITDAFALLQRGDEADIKVKHELEAQIDEAVVSYHESLKRINQCENKDQVPNLVEAKNSRRDSLCSYLNKYLTACSASTNETSINELVEMSQKLKKRLKSSVDMNLNKHHSSLDELFEAYNLLKASRRTSSDEAQRNTDDAHKSFLKEFSKLQMVFHLYPAKAESDEGVIFPPCANLEQSFSAFDTAVCTLQKALGAELDLVHKQTKSEEHTNPSLIECLLKHVDNCCQKLKEESKALQKYSTLLVNLSALSSSVTMVSHVTDVRKRIKGIKSKLRHKLADKKDLEETDYHDEAAILEVDESITALQRELHTAFVEEDKCLKCLGQSFDANFLELDLEYPELGLSKYAKTDGLLHYDWEFEHFTCQKLPKCMDICYESQFLGKPVVLKEFLLENEEKSKQLTERVLAWNAVENGHLTKVMAMFGGNHRQMYVIMPRMKRLSEERSMSFTQCCNILLAVLENLKTLHSHHLIHTLIHPSTVLLDEGSVALDFVFETKYHRTSDTEFGGISFEAPELTKGVKASEASDMYAFGCLLLLVLFPNLQFKFGRTGCVNVSVHRTVIESHLSSKDYNFIVLLIHSDVRKRPTAKFLLKSGFLKEIKPVQSQEHVLDAESVCTEVPQERQVIEQKKNINTILEPAKTESVVTKPELPLTETKSDKGITEKGNGKNSILHHVSLLRKPLNCAENSISAVPLDSCEIVDNLDVTGNGNSKDEKDITENTALTKNNTIFQRLVTAFLESNPPKTDVSATIVEEFGLK